MLHLTSYVMITTKGLFVSNQYDSFTTSKINTISLKPCINATSSAIITNVIISTHHKY